MICGTCYLGLELCDCKPFTHAIDDPGAPQDAPDARKETKAWLDRVIASRAQRLEVSPLPASLTQEPAPTYEHGFPMANPGDPIADACKAVAETWDCTCATPARVGLSGDHGLPAGSCANCGKPI